MKLLVLGGTSFVGRHLVEVARARGDEVAIFNRGRRRIFGADVEQLVGDRFGDLAALAAPRAWDLVVDLSAYVPSVVARSSRLLADRAARLVYVSTVSVHGAEPVDAARLAECEALGASDDPMQARRFGASYGGLKLLCEEAARDAFGARAAIVRPCIVAGPHDPTDRFTYWVRRIAEGGDVLAPAPAVELIQIVDARDLARWILDAPDDGADVAAPPLAFGDVLETIVRVANPAARLVWSDAARAGLTPWHDLPFWGGRPAYRSPSRLAVTPIAETIAATLAWVRATPVGELPRGPWIDLAREAAALQAMTGTPNRPS